MRTDISYLSEGKQRELTFVVELIREGFAEALLRRTQERYRNGRIIKVVLFGSYARADWVEDPVGRYFSGYDLLVVVNHEDLTASAEFWGPTETRLLAKLSVGTRLRTPVSLIVHNLDDVNAPLRLGRYFFMDIVREGILLEDEPDIHSCNRRRCRRKPPWRKRARISQSGSLAPTSSWTTRGPMPIAHALKRGIRTAPGRRALLPLPAAHPIALQPQDAQFEPAACTLRRAGAQANWRLARHDQVRAAMLRASSRGLREGAVLAPVPDQGRSSAG